MEHLWVSAEPIKLISLQFIKYVCRVPLRLSEEELLIGDDAIHGEVAYYMAEDVVGVVPDPNLLHGQQPRHVDLETGGSGSSSPHVNKLTSQEVKQD